MTKEQFIEEYHCHTYEDGIKCNQSCNDCKKTCEEDINSVIASEQCKLVTNGPMCYQNGYEHVQKCPDCNGWIFFNDKDFIIESIGGVQTKRKIHCDACKKDQLIFPWRCL